MPSLPSRRLARNWPNIRNYILRHLNFYRIHILVFTFTPLICSGIIYAANGEYKIAYIDCLFNSVSAMAVCGLATIDLSKMTPFQQFMLFIQMCLGNPVLVSWVMVYIRRSFFAKKFQHIMEVNIAHKLSEKTHSSVEVKIVPWWRRALELVLCQESASADSFDESGSASSIEHRMSRVRPDMIRRMNDAPRLVNPSGWISEGHSELLTAQQGDETRCSDPHTPLRFLSFSDIDNPTLVKESNVASPTEQHERESSSEDIESVSVSDSESSSDTVDSEVASMRGHGNRHSDHEPHRAFSDPGTGELLVESPVSETRGFPPQSASVTIASPTRNLAIPRTQTIEFANVPRPVRDARSPERYPSRPLEPTLSNHTTGTGYRDRQSIRGRTLSTSHTYDSYVSVPRPHVGALHSGFGGFPMPHEIVSRLFHRFFPKLESKLTRTMTMPRTRTIVSQHGSLAPGARPVSYISFEAVVGRNSTFKSLTREQLEELGGVEFRALGALLWIVGGYHILMQLLAFVIIAPYMSMSRWKDDFKPPQLYRDTSPVWFSAFQVVTAYTNSGMSLEDESMVPFQRAYPMIVVMIILILGGNTAFPIFLRFIIWTTSKIVPARSRVKETLHFLLDHPRRCFIYLFPSNQTWFLLTVLLALNFTDWFCFLVLDLGNPTVMSIPTGVRVLIGMLQAVAVRAAGFGTVALSDLAPAVKSLYVVMMYVSVYPVAMSVRSTNVYEEKSLGVFEDDEESIDEEAFKPTGSRVTVWSSYLAMHIRKQLSFDMWWLAIALVLICIIERDPLENEDNATWFNIFRILFEIVSAYGGVGLSLGVPYDNYSFSGAFHTLSKLIVCLVMLRGRHRGLPVAIDRAVMLPVEFEQQGDEDTHPDVSALSPIDDGKTSPHPPLPRQVERLRDEEALSS